MVRWEPGARERLQAAALELFATRGFEQTTAAEIAQSVGLTERTFFRHFSDKREVLFYGQQQFLQAFIDGVDAAPPDASPLEIIACALHAAASFFPDERRPYSRMRQSVIDQNPALRERELHKLAGLATTVAQALRARGISEPAATLAAESGATVFGIAFAQWIREGETRSLFDIASDVLHELLNLTGAATRSPNLPIVGTAYEPPVSQHGPPGACPAREIDSCQYLPHTGRVTTTAGVQALPVRAAGQLCCAPLLREPLTAAQAADLARALKALADPVRLRLVSMVAAHEGGEACVCDLTEPLGLTQPTVSHHLKILVDAGIFSRDKRGVWAYYALRPAALQALAGILGDRGPHVPDPPAGGRG